MQIRVEFLRDERNGKISAALYFPPEADKPAVRTRTIYPTENRALLGAVKLFSDALEGGRGAAADLDAPQQSH